MSSTRVCIYTTQVPEWIVQDPAHPIILEATFDITTAPINDPKYEGRYADAAFHMRPIRDPVETHRGDIASNNYWGFYLHRISDDAKEVKLPPPDTENSESQRDENDRYVYKRLSVHEVRARIAAAETEWHAVLQARGLAKDVVLSTLEVSVREEVNKERLRLFEPLDNDIFHIGGFDDEFAHHRGDMDASFCVPLSYLYRGFKAWAQWNRESDDAARLPANLDMTEWFLAFAEFIRLTELANQSRDNSGLKYPWNNGFINLE
jgi:hypothetical protein